jgi:hypothetical protein
MNRVVSLAALLSCALVLTSYGDDPPAAEKGEAVARISVPGMECDGICPPTVKAALAGDGVKDVVVDFAKKTAVVRYEAEKTRALDALARLKAQKAYSQSSLVSAEAVYDAAYVKVSASSDLKKKGARGKIHVVLEPRRGHGYNTDPRSPDLELEVKALPDDLKCREPLTKLKGGVRTTKTFDFDLDVASKAKTGEETVVIEVRLEDVSGAEKKLHVIDLAVPALIP